MIFLVVVLTFAITCGALTAWRASIKNKNQTFWFVFGTISPVLALVVLAFLHNTKRCIDCGEKILQEARRCKHCGSFQ